MKASETIEDLIASSGADSVAICYRPIESDTVFAIRPDEVFPSASTMKLCVLVELFHRVESEGVSLDEQLRLRNEFASLADGSPFQVDPLDDSEKTLHERLGQTESLRTLATLMITHSGNLPTNLLIDRLGADSVTRFMRELGIAGLTVLRGVVDGKAYDLGLNNTVTARGLTDLLVKIGRSEVVSSAACAAMIDILCRQTHRESIPAGLPRGVRVANKTGWYDGICHDTGIVFPEQAPPYALTVLTSGPISQDEAQALIAAISGAIWRMHTLGD